MEDPEGVEEDAGSGDYTGFNRTVNNEPLCSSTNPDGSTSNQSRPKVTALLNSLADPDDWNPFEVLQQDFEVGDFIEEEAELQERPELKGERPPTTVTSSSSSGSSVQGPPARCAGGQGAYLTNDPAIAVRLVRGAQGGQQGNVQEPPEEWTGGPGGPLRPPQLVDQPNGERDAAGILPKPTRRLRKKTTIQEVQASLLEASSLPLPEVPGETGAQNSSAFHSSPSSSRRRLAGESLASFSKRLKLINEEADCAWRQHVLDRIHLAQIRESKVEVQDGGLVSGSWGRIHTSHRRMILKDYIFCMRCGLWSQLRLSSALLHECSGTTSRGTSSRLKRMLGGYHPVASVVTWPDGSPTSEPYTVRCLDPS